ncbi:hypothetical protein WN51_06251 [Melipona quadrifasciata]|uniref:Uncharacterized protein n=1 Tax=Melipona quadrifasciata TaxID=166423 RepID=A0A0M8ZSQ8_9HYME|nr:hypothetical protein WN51_06251 [Melipona quadrifasciata]
MKCRALTQLNSSNFIFLPTGEHLNVQQFERKDIGHPVHLAKSSTKIHSCDSHKKNHERSTLLDDDDDDDGRKTKRMGTVTPGNGSYLIRTLSLDDFLRSSVVGPIEGEGKRGGKTVYLPTFVNKAAGTAWPCCRDQVKLMMKSSQTRNSKIRQRKTAIFMKSNGTSQIMEIYLLEQQGLLQITPRFIRALCPSSILRVLSVFQSAGTKCKLYWSFMLPIIGRLLPYYNVLSSVKNMPTSMES